MTADNGAGLTQSATTDGQGLYAVELPAGAYTISVTAGGAKIFEAKAILSPGQVLTLGVAARSWHNLRSPLRRQALLPGPPTKEPLPGPSAIKPGQESREQR